ncbi:MAG: hypothetical protein LBV13_02850 [Methanomassiliicoccaceae archaeon]|jgi:ribose-phosphate pyrophosphokinase|nr:hypothetical protein [Methanomassiliicoccaceae archaeon]
MLRINGIPLPIRRYPDETMRLSLVAEGSEAVIEWLYEKDEEMALFFVAKHLREQCAIENVTLYMPYVPNARMDRVKERDEVFTLKYFCDLINSLAFNKVIVRDVHSDVSMTMLNNAVQEPVDDLISGLAGRILNANKDIVFFPDEGSRRRYSGTINFLSAYGIKERDWATGEIKGLRIHGEVPATPFDVLIVDDISSYGGTFLRAAKELKRMGAENIYLYVTHCENSILKGELINSGLIRKIYTTRSIFSLEHPLIEVIGGNGGE